MLYSLLTHNGIPNGIIKASLVYIWYFKITCVLAQLIGEIERKLFGIYIYLLQARIRGNDVFAIEWCAWPAQFLPFRLIALSISH